MAWLDFCNDSIVITGSWMLNLRRRTFWKLIINANLLVELKEKTTMREAQAMNFKDLGLSCCSYSELMQFRSIYYLVSNQVSMQ